MGLKRNVHDLLSRLGKVRRTGESTWIACCPAHPDKSPSMSIADRDGTVLLHCFAGCEVASIVGAVGMDLTDLFPENMDEHRTGKLRVPFNPMDVLRCVAQEALVVSICAAAVGEDKTLLPDDRKRLALATHRLHAALEAARV